MEPEPKRFTVRWRDGSYRVSDPTLPDEVHAYHADDPAIVQALAVHKACHEAGLLDEHGNLRKIIGKPIILDDGSVVMWGGVFYGVVPAGIWELHVEKIIEWGRAKRFSTRSAAERAAGEAGNGGNDGQ